MYAINQTAKIMIVSGYGEYGSVEEHKGKKTERAIRAKLTKMRNANMWARAMVYSHTNEWGDVYVNVETGAYGAL